MFNSTIRPVTQFGIATHSDIIIAARMVFESYAPYIPIMGKIPPTIFEDFGYHINQGNLWLQSLNGEYIGMVVLTPKSDHMLLQSMCVLPGYQSLGLGRQILKFSEKRTRFEKLDVIRLYTNELMERNQKIYKKQGFVETHRTPYDWGWRVHMEKSLRVRQSRSQHMADALCQV